MIENKSLAQLAEAQIHALRLNQWQRRRLPGALKYFSQFHPEGDGMEDARRTVIDIANGSLNLALIFSFQSKFGTPICIPFQPKQPLITKPEGAGTSGASICEQETVQAFEIDVVHAGVRRVNEVFFSSELFPEVDPAEDNTYHGFVAVSKNQNPINDDEVSIGIVLKSGDDSHLIRLVDMLDQQRGQL